MDSGQGMEEGLGKKESKCLCQGPRDGTTGSKKILFSEALFSGSVGC